MEKLFNTLKGISILVAISYFFSLATDLVSTVWCCLLGKEYKWRSIRMVSGQTDKWAAILLCIAIIFGTYCMLSIYGDSRAKEIENKYQYQIEELTPELVECDRCFEKFPEEY